MIKTYIIILEGYIQCVFCNKIITVEYIPLLSDDDYYCCKNQKLNNDNTCTNCGTVYPKYLNDEYINVHENKYKLKTKSVYFR